MMSHIPYKSREYSRNRNKRSGASLGAKIVTVIAFVAVLLCYGFVGGLRP